MRAHLLIAAILVAMVSCTPDASLAPSSVPPANTPTDSAATAPADTSGAPSDTSGTPTDTSETPADTSKVVRAGYYVSPQGQPDGFGTKDAPWDLQTALNQPGKVMPGDTIWMLGGTYRNSAHDFISKLTGTANAPVVLRQYPGDSATIDGRLDINGSYAYYWGFEVTDSDPMRVTAIAGSRPSDLPRNMVDVFVTGPFNKIINLVVHDLGDGLFAGSSAEGLEIYGSLFYDNGWQGPDRGHGHNIYLQNENATKYVLDNVLFNSFSQGLHIYGSDQAYLQNFDIEGNTIFESGSPTAAVFGYSQNIIEQGGAGQFGRSMYQGNSVYHIDGISETVRFNTPGGEPGTDIEFVNNVVQGRAAFNEMNVYKITGNMFTSGTTVLSGQNALLGFRAAPSTPLSANTWDHNSYATPPGGDQGPFYAVEDGSGTIYDFPTWQRATGYDANGSFTSGTFTGAKIIVRRNKYEPGRAFVTCWNWQSAASLAVDLSGVLKVGDHYQIHHVYDVFGPAVVSGTYDGGLVSIPQTGYVAPTPFGYGVTPASTSPEFNVFLVTKG